VQECLGIGARDGENRQIVQAGAGGAGKFRHRVLIHGMHECSDMIHMIAAPARARMRARTGIRVMPRPPA